VSGHRIHTPARLRTLRFASAFRSGWRGWRFKSMVIMPGFRSTISEEVSRQLGFRKGSSPTGPVPNSKTSEPLGMISAIRCRRNFHWSENSYRSHVLRSLVRKAWNTAVRASFAHCDRRPVTLVARLEDCEFRQFLPLRSFISLPRCAYALRPSSICRSTVFISGFRIEGATSQAVSACLSSVAVHSRAARSTGNTPMPKSASRPRNLSR